MGDDVLLLATDEHLPGPYFAEGVGQRFKLIAPDHVATARALRQRRTALGAQPDLSERCDRAVVAAGHHLDTMRP